LAPVPRIFGRTAAQPVSRVRPGDPAWPSAAFWDRLKRDVGGRLIEIRSPFAVCRDDAVGLPCDELFGELKNPYYVGDDPALTQTAGWVDAWTAQPSVYAVAAETAADGGGSHKARGLGWCPSTTLTPLIAGWHGLNVVSPA
jgi:hypothetical protein